MIKESKVIEKVKKLFKAIFKNPLVIKIHVSVLHNRGFPDLLIITEFGVFFLEVKRPKNKLTPLQKATLLNIQRSGEENIYVYWVTCDVKESDKLLFYDPQTDELKCEINACRDFYRRLNET